MFNSAPTYNNTACQLLPAPIGYPYSALPPTRKELNDKQRMDTRQETIDRHAQMKCITREMRIRPDSDTKHAWMRRLFTEGRWCYNWYLQQYQDGKKLGQIITTDEFVVVLTPGGYESRRLVNLSAQSRQELKKELSKNIKSIATNIKKGNIKHATMHYKQECDSIPLKKGAFDTSTSGITFAINEKRTRLYLSNCPFVLKLTGGKQLPLDAEIANGRIVRRAGEYFLQVTFYMPYEKSAPAREEELYGSVDKLMGVGFDFNITRQIVDDGNNSWGWFFEESARLKKAQADNEAYRAWHRREFGWAVSSKHQLRIMNEEYEKLSRRKKVAVDEFIGAVRKCSGFVAVQDEQLKSWHADERYSSVVHHSVMGGIMARLKKEPSTLVVGEWTRTTGVCPDCGHVLGERLDTSVREWDCPDCGAHHDRDQAAARVVLLLAAVQFLYPDCPSVLDPVLHERLLLILSGRGARSLIGH